MKVIVLGVVVGVVLGGGDCGGGKKGKWLCYRLWLG